jgi:hypothetical protein
MFQFRGLAGPLVASLILAVPLWCVTIPGMPDYPAHLASFALIGGAPSHFYEIRWAFVPNLASEVLVPLLAHIVSLNTATKLFLSATLFLWAIGPALIHRALFGQVNFGALAAALFAYNANFMWGFFNYTFATGLGFVVFALWIETEQQKPSRRLPLFAVLFTLLYFCHLFAFATLLLAIACYEIAGWRQALPRNPIGLLHRAVPVAIATLPAALAYLLLKPAGTADSHIIFDFADTMLDRAGAAVQLGFDNPIYLATAALALVLVIGLITRTAIVHPRMRIALVVFAIAAVTAPEWALGGWGVHMRLPPVFGALAFAAAEWHLPRRARAAAGLLLLGAAAAAATVVVQQWRPLDNQYTEFEARLADIPPGTRLLTVLDGDSLGWESDQPYWHLGELAIAPRDAFTQLLFTTRGQHILAIRPPMNRYAAAAAQQGSPPDIDELDNLAAGRIDADEDIRDIFPYLRFFQCHYDMALVIHGRGPHARTPTMLRDPKEGSFFSLYKIAPDAHCR